MTAPLPQTFPGPDGSAWPAEWTRTYPNGLTFTQQAGKGRIAPANAYDNAAMHLSGAEVDVDVVDEVGLSSLAGWSVYLIARGRNFSGLTAADGIVLELRVYRGPGQPINVHLSRRAGGTSVLVDEADVAVPALPGRFYVRRSYVGGALRVKVWPTTADEPAAWLLEATDPNPLPAGAFQVAAFASEGTVGQYVEVDGPVRYADLTPGPSLAVTAPPSPHLWPDRITLDVAHNGTAVSSTLEARPAGSSAIIAAGNTTAPYVIPDEAGSYVIATTATNANGTTVVRSTVDVIANLYRYDDQLRRRPVRLWLAGVYTGAEPPAAPVLPAATDVTADGFTVPAWPAVAGAASYAMQLATGAGELVDHGSMTTPGPYVVTDLDPETAYRLVARTVDADGMSSEASNVVEVTTSAAPVDPPVDPPPTSTTTHQLEWKDKNNSTVTDAGTYRRATLIAAGNLELQTFPWEANSSVPLTGPGTYEVTIRVRRGAGGPGGGGISANVLTGSGSYLGNVGLEGIDTGSGAGWDWLADDAWVSRVWRFTLDATGYADAAQLVLMPYLYNGGAGTTFDVEEAVQLRKL